MRGNYVQKIVTASACLAMLGCADAHVTHTTSAANASSRISIAQASIEAIPPFRQLATEDRSVIRVYAQIQGAKNADATIECTIGGKKGVSTTELNHFVRNSFAEISISENESNITHGATDVRCNVRLASGVEFEVKDEVNIEKPNFPDDKLSLYSQLPQYVYDCDTKGPAVENQQACIGLIKESAAGFAPSQATSECFLDSRPLKDDLPYSQGTEFPLGALTAGAHRLSCTIHRRHRWEKKANNKFDLEFDVLTRSQSIADLRIITTTSNSFVKKQVYPGRGDSPTFINGAAFYVRVKNDGPSLVPKLHITCNDGEFEGWWLAQFAHKSRGSGRPDRFQPLLPGEVADVLVTTSRVKTPNKSGTHPRASLSLGSVYSQTCSVSSSLPSNTPNKRSQAIHIVASTENE